MAATRKKTRLKSPPAPPEPAPDSASERLCQRIKALRRERNWSLEALATVSGVSRSMLSEIERGRANPTLAVVCRIAQAFGRSVGELVESPGEASTIHVIRADDRAHLYRSDPQCTIRTLSPLNLEKDVEFYEVTLRQDGELRSAPHFAGTREFLTVHQGRVRVSSNQDTEELGPGDSASYRADVPHAIVNPGAESCVVFLVVIYRQA
jgi:transcriptional regulator with XRE-family HTH domain